ncbi:hypothetical protein F4778DRAFT_655942 [Xylariomycetidae sp. FL2044]|nr:hypothetical protein F4778DRAFT_655942 [Xylariomycetidae sp. FL2044]
MLEWWAVGTFHVIVATGVALVGTGAAALEQSSEATQSDLVLLDVGVSMLAASWLILCFWTAISFLPAQQIKTATSHSGGTVLLYSVALSLMFTGIRVLYTLIALVSRRTYLNPVNGSLALRVVLSFLPELIVTILFIVAGIRTRNAVGQHNK